MSWLSTVQNWVGERPKGNGLVIALILAVLSVAIGIAVAVNWRAKEFLDPGDCLNLAYWVVGQGFGGIFQGGATDPNAGLLFVVFAYAMYALVPTSSQLAQRRARKSPARRSPSRAEAGPDDANRLAATIEGPASRGGVPIAGNSLSDQGAPDVWTPQIHSAGAARRAFAALATLLAGLRQRGEEPDRSAPRRRPRRRARTARAAWRDEHGGRLERTAGSVSVNGIKPVPTQMLGVGRPGRG